VPSTTLDRESLAQTLANARQALLDARTAGGWWEGELSSSALSTATAVFAIHLLLGAIDNLPPEREREVLDEATETACRGLIRDGLAWLALHQNRDGGWGDTMLSLSNISTTALCWAAFAADAPGAGAAYGNVVRAAEGWLTQHAGGCGPEFLVPAIIARYGEDKTFSVPILTMCALAGRLGEGRAAWKSVPQLPFELAAFPQRGFKWLRLPVVSYALPALIAIGLVRHVKRPTRNPAARIARAAARRRALRLIERIQPQSGGFLEAAPLTSFVIMSLVGAGEFAHPVVKRSIDFLIRGVRPDGSWPIDTNLATWVTTLAVNALAIDTGFTTHMPDDQRRRICDWLLDQQYRREHPYTLADPGGWAWTPLSGGVPDADDTSGALLALWNLGFRDERTKAAAMAGVQWLMKLQNRDGGIPTFCRGWGNLLFDRSSADITAHTLRAFNAWSADVPSLRAKRGRRACFRASKYLVGKQRADGAWTPLWFGNQHAPDDENPTYGTARVLCMGAIPAAPPFEHWRAFTPRGLRWLLQSQNADGGWGGAKDTPSSIEETALAVEALADLRPRINELANRADDARLPAALDEAIARGVAWLIAATDHGRVFPPSPIGFYFAKLWYYEKLYPLIFTVAALHAAEDRPRSFP